MVYTYAAKLIRAIDGDTVVLELEKEFELKVDFGFHILDTVHLHKKAQMTFRLIGINTPELGGTTKEAGLKAKAEVERLLALGEIRAETEKPDKYGRWLARLYVKQPDGSELYVNQALISGGFAIAYNP